MKFIEMTGKQLADVVRDDDELLISAVTADQLHKTLHVGIIKGGIRLVQDAEPRAADGVHREEQRQENQAALSAAQAA